MREIAYTIAMGAVILMAATAAVVVIWFCIVGVMAFVAERREERRLNDEAARRAWEAQARDRVNAARSRTRRRRL